MNETIVTQIHTILGDATQGTIAIYTQYFINASVIYIAVSICLAFALVSNKLWDKFDFDDDEIKTAKVIRLLAFVFIVLPMFITNMVDIFNPEAMAIHQLLKDLTC